MESLEGSWVGTEVSATWRVIGTKGHSPPVTDIWDPTNRMLGSLGMLNICNQMLHVVDGALYPRGVPWSFLMTTCPEGSSFSLPTPVVGASKGKKEQTGVHNGEFNSHAVQVYCPSWSGRQHKLVPAIFFKINLPPGWEYFPAMHAVGVATPGLKRLEGSRKFCLLK